MTYAHASRSIAPVAGRPVRQTTLSCSCCSQVLSLSANNVQGTVPDQVMHKRAMRQGWTARRGKYRCKGCSSH